jgi:hypothetical protein
MLAGDALEIGSTDPELHVRTQGEFSNRFPVHGHRAPGFDAPEPCVAVVGDLDPGMGPVDGLVIRQDDGVGQGPADCQAPGQVEFISLAVRPEDAQQEAGGMPRTSPMG